MNLTIHVIGSRYRELKDSKNNYIFNSSNFILTTGTVLTLTKETSYNFLFRNGKSEFDIPDYKVKLLFDEDNSIKEILLINEYGVLVLSEVNMIIDSIQKGYSNLLLLDAFISHLQFDFDVNKGFREW